MNPLTHLTKKNPLPFLGLASVLGAVVSSIFGFLTNLAFWILCILTFFTGSNLISGFLMLIFSSSGPGSNGSGPGRGSGPGIGNGSGCGNGCSL